MCIFSENEIRLTTIGLMTTKQGVEFDRIINASVPGLAIKLRRIRRVYINTLKYNFVAPDEV